MAQTARCGALLRISVDQVSPPHFKFRSGRAGAFCDFIILFFVIFFERPLLALTFYFWLLWFARTKFAGLHFDHILVPELASDFNVAPSDLAAPHHRSSFQKIAYSHPASFDAKDVVVQATFDEEHPLKLAKCGAFLSSRFQRQFDADLEYYSVVARSAHQHPQYTCLCIFRVVCMYVCACMHARRPTIVWAVPYSTHPCIWRWLGCAWGDQQVGPGLNGSYSRHLR